MSYTIQKGDTLGRLASQWSTTVQDIMRANPYITDPNKIYTGKTLAQPGRAAPAATTKAPAAAPIAPAATTQAPGGTTQQPDQHPLTGFQPTQFPYEQILQQLMQDRPQYSQTPEQMLAQSQQYAGLQIDPQVRTLQQREQDAARQGMSTAVARGVARGGGYDKIMQDQQEYFNPQFLDLEARRGDLTAQHLAGLQSQQYDRGVGDWSMQSQAAQNLAQMAQGHGAAEWARALDLHDRTMLTPLQQLQMHLGYTDALGEIPQFMIDQYGGQQKPTAPTGSTSTSPAPSGGGSYTIKSGDTLGALAKQWGTTVNAIMQANPSITDPNKIYAGRSLVKP